MDDLLEKLKALGLKVEKAADLEPPVEPGLLLEQTVRGTWLDELTRGVYLVEKTLPLGSNYGQVTLIPPTTLDYLEQFAGLNANLSTEKILFLDTETSSLSTGTGAFVFMIGMAYFSGESLKISQIFLEKPEYEAEFLCYFDDFLKYFDTFASYNGKAFDIPMLRSRFILSRLPVSFNGYAHLDLLHFARRIWKLRLESRRLAEIEKEILAFSRNEEEIPGWLVPQIYFDYLASRDAAPLKGVFYHNEMDVASLAALFIHINRLLENSNALTGSDGRDAYAIGNVFEKLGKWELSRDFLKAGMEQGLPDELKKEAVRSFANTLKKEGKWDDAMQYWEFAAGMDDYLACIELAKLYEHRQKDPQSALKWVHKAVLLTCDPHYDQPALELRRIRLEKKCEVKCER